MDEARFAMLERSAIKASEELAADLHGLLSLFDRETLLAIAEYREAIRPDGWMQRMIREFVENYA